MSVCPPLPFEREQAHPAERHHDKGERRPSTPAPTGKGSSGAAYCFALEASVWWGIGETAA
jgi:hypothetical protein